MDLKHYIKIFLSNWIWFLLTIIVVVGAGYGYKKYQNSKPISYEVSLLLNVTRSGIQATEAYRYDDFYRIQADEKFAETVVKWIASPRIVTNVFNETGIASGGISIRELSKIFKAKKMSSQMIDVRFKSTSAREAQDISEALVGAINKESKNLNQFQKEDNWFKIVGEEPVIKEFRLTLKDVLPISLILGIFLGIWVVLIRHYLKKD